MRRGMVASWLIILGCMHLSIAALFIYVIQSHLARVSRSELRSSGFYGSNPVVTDVQLCIMWYDLGWSQSREMIMTTTPTPLSEHRLGTWTHTFQDTKTYTSKHVCQVRYRKENLDIYLVTYSMSMSMSTFQLLSEGRWWKVMGAGVGGRANLSMSMSTFQILSEGRW